ncbi:MAG: BNR/Asp-box repeat domain protein [Labilithrix sp.]|nr:BNR/Asp-box repeat domain protein [Labilithrix sp.]
MRSFPGLGAPHPKRTHGSRRPLRYVSPVRTAFFAGSFALVAIAAAAWPSEARANGRFPESNAIFFSQNDPNAVLLRTTFGLIDSRDRGKTWDWVCERSVGLAGVEDPMYSITPDGTIVSSTFQGLAVSHDRACNWAYIGGELKDLVFIDVASRPATPGTVVAFASSYDGQDDAGAIFFKSTLFETKDEGKTFTALGPGLDRTLLGETVDVTPSDPDRVYVSAVRNPGTQASAFLLTSKDHGKTFVENKIALIEPERAAFIAAVDPLNADRLYVRTANAIDMPSRLLVSDDAGKTFRTVFTGKGSLAGFALSKDGTKVWVGGPIDGIRQASTTDFAFVQKSTIEVQCLAFADDGLWACSTEKSGFVVGLSKDEGATFETKMHFCDIRGPLDCPAGSTTHTECTLGGTTSMASPPWPQQRAMLGCGGGDVDAGMIDSGLGDGAATPAAPDEMEGGGGCSVRAPSSATPFAALLAGIGAAIALVRRRRR